MGTAVQRPTQSLTQDVTLTLAGTLVGTFTGTATGPVETGRRRARSSTNRPRDNITGTGESGDRQRARRGPRPTQSLTQDVTLTSDPRRNLTVAHGSRAADSRF